MKTGISHENDKIINEFFDSMEPVLIVDIQTGIIVSCNKASCELLERSKEEIIGMHQKDMEQSPGIDNGYSQSFKKHMTDFDGKTLAVTLKTKSGKSLPIAIKAGKYSSNGKDYLYGILRKLDQEELRIINDELTIEIAMRKQIETLYLMENNILELITQDRPLTQILEKVMEILEFGLPDAMLGILLLDPETNRLKTMATNGIPLNLLKFKEEKVLGADENKITKNYVFTDNLCSNPEWKKFCELVKKASYKSCWSVPVLNSNHDVLGTIDIFYKNDISLSEKEQGLVNDAAYLAGIAIEKNQNIEKIRASELKWRTLVNSIADNIITVDSNYNILYINHADSQPDAGQYISKNIFSLVHEEYCEELKFNIDGLLDGSIADTVYMDIKSRPTNSLYALRINCVKDSGKQDYIIIIATNITNLKFIEESLAKSEKQFRRIFENAPYGLLITSRQGKIENVNPAFCEMIGYTCEELKGMTFFDITHPEDRVISNNILGKTDDKIQKILRFEKRYITKERKTIWARLTIVTVTNEAEEVEYFLTQVEDITQQKKADEKNRVMEKKLMVSQKLETIGRLAGGIAHDFNNILTPVLLVSDYLMMEYKNDEELLNKIQTIKNAVIRGKDLVKQIMTFSKSNTDNLTEINLGDLISDARELIKPALGSSIKLHVDIRDDFKIKASPTQIHQVLMNICINAIQAMKDKNEGHIEIKLYKKPDCATGTCGILEITDNGCGISDKNLHNIFDPFFTTKEEHTNTGIGLSVVHGIIKGLGGEITVNSKEGFFTTFIIRLPVLSGEKGV